MKREQLRATVREFFDVYGQYRRTHPWHYAARIAYGVAFRHLPF